MTATNRLILLAFLSALPKLETPLPKELQHKIHQAGQLLTTDLATATNLLLEVSQWSPLQPEFESVYQSLFDSYDEQIRKTIPQDDLPDHSLNGFLENQLPEEYPKISALLQSDSPELAIKAQAEESRAKLPADRTQLDMIFVLTEYFIG